MKDQTIESRPPKIALITPKSGPFKDLGLFVKALGGDIIWDDHALSAPEHAPRWKRLISAFWSAVTFPNRKQYDLLITNGTLLMPVFLKKLGLVGKHQLMIVYHVNETLFFLYSNYYSKIAASLQKEAFKVADASMILAEMGLDIYDHIFDGQQVPPRYLINTGTRAEIMNKFEQSSPDFSSKTMIFIGNVDLPFRGYYKGMDILFKSVEALADEFPDMRLIVIGTQPEAYREKMMAENCPNAKDRIHFTGQIKQEEMLELFSSSAFYVHPARGEGFGRTITEAMAAGLVPLVSEWTGAKEAAARVDGSLVSGLDQAEFTSHLRTLLQTPEKQLSKWSQDSRAIGLEYTLENAELLFYKQLNQICADLGRGDLRIEEKSKANIQ